MGICGEDNPKLEQVMSVVNLFSFKKFPCSIIIESSRFLKYTIDLEKDFV